MMQLINIVLIWLFMGLLCAHFARKRGRNPLTWFAIGLSLGIFAVGMIFLMPKIEKKAPEPVPVKPLPVKRSEAWLKMWYYLDPTHAQQGPLEFPDLIKIWREQRISDSTYIWGEGMPEWKRLRDQPEILKEFQQI